MHSQSELYLQYTIYNLLYLISSSEDHTFCFNNGGTSGSRYVKSASTLREFLLKAVLYMSQQYILPTISKGKQQIKMFQTHTYFWHPSLLKHS